MYQKKTVVAVANVLKNNVDTRNHDKTLILKVWEAEGLSMTAEFRQKFLQGTISTPDSITRAKRNLQSQGLYRPAGEAYVARKDKAEKIRTNIRTERAIPAEIDRPTGECPTCGARFISEQHLIGHIKKAHQKA
jgi:hypothetical protein